MTESALEHRWSADRLAPRLVRYDDLVPCTTAFLDTRTPGSDRKENFTIIGPGGRTACLRASSVGGMASSCAS